MMMSDRRLLSQMGATLFRWSGRDPAFGHAPYPEPRPIVRRGSLEFPSDICARLSRRVSTESDSSVKRPRAKSRRRGLSNRDTARARYLFSRATGETLCDAVEYKPEFYNRRRRIFGESGAEDARAASDKLDLRKRSPPRARLVHTSFAIVIYACQPDDGREKNGAASRATCNYESSRA